MTSNENFCLRLNGFERDVKVSWQELQMEKDFCDVTLACEDKQIKTHKVIISACSPVLRNILKLNQNQNPLIYLRRVKYRHLQSLLSFMYQGEVDVAEEDLSKFLEVAEDLNIRGLSERNMERNQQNGDTSLKPSYEDIDSSLDSELSSKNEMETEKNVPIGSFINDAEDCENSISDTNTSSPFYSRKANTGLIRQTYFENKNQNAISTFGGKGFNCEKCEKQFSTQSLLNRHKATVHENIRYSCSKCEYKATRKHQLKVHVQSVHDGHRYRCDNCDLTATTKGNLHAHQKKYHN